MATITVRVDDEVKRQAELLFDDLGLNMTSAINMFIKKALSVNGIPFDVVRGYNNETIQAMLEADRIAHDDNVKGYTDLDELFKELDD